MNRRLAVALALLFTLAGCSSKSATTGSSAKGGAADAAKLPWERFESSEGKFAAMFPGKPIDMSPGGDSVKAFAVELPGGNAYVVTWSDHADDVKRLGVDGALNVATTLYLEGKKQLDDKSVKVLGHPAREIVGIDSEGDVMHTRIILAGNRLYTVAFIIAKAEYSKSDKRLAKFLDSFEILE